MDSVEFEKKGKVALKQFERDCKIKPTHWIFGRAQVNRLIPGRRPKYLRLNFLGLPVIPADVDDMCIAVAAQKERPIRQALVETIPLTNPNVTMTIARDVVATFIERHTKRIAQIPNEEEREQLACLIMAGAAKSGYSKEQKKELIRTVAKLEWTTHIPALIVRANSRVTGYDLVKGPPRDEALLPYCNPAPVIVK